MDTYYTEDNNAIDFSMRTRSREYWKEATKAPRIGSESSEVDARQDPGTWNCHNYRSSKD